MPGINSIMGNFGRYQLGLCVLIFMSNFGVAFHQMAIIFLAPPVSYNCPDNSTCCNAPEYNKTKFTKTIVTEWNLICGRSWLIELTQTLFQFGMICGSLVFGIASDRFGRRRTLITAVVLEVFLGMMTSFLPDFWSFTTVRMILGLAVGGIVVVGFVIIVENVGSTHRYILSSLFHVSFALGYILLGIFGYLIRDYTYFQLGISLSTVILLIYICLLLESPRWLLATNKTVKATGLLKYVAKFNNLSTDNIQEQIELYQLKHLKEQRRQKHNIVDLFRSPNLRKNILVMSFICFVNNYCLFGVSHYIRHLTDNIYVYVVMSGCVCLLACIVSIPAMKCLPRRTLLIISNVFSSLSLFLAISIPEGIGSVTLGCISIFFSFMAFVVAYLYCSEMFPTVIRSTALGYSSMLARSGAMISPFVISLKLYGIWYALITFSIFPLIAASLCLMLPETKNCELLMTIEEGESFGSTLNVNLDRNNVTENVT